MPVPPTPDQIAAAASVLAGRVRRTPVLEVGPEVAGVPVVLKLELLQHTGSFKIRGAFHRVLTAPGGIPEAGLVAASGGNHGLAVAHVARALGARAEVYVPEVSPPAKVERLRRLGAEVVVVGAVYDEAQAACNARQACTGALLVHPYDHPAVMAGAGTVGLELDEQAPGLDTVLVACGGGGLIGGIASWFGRRAKVVSVEPQRCCCLHAALAAGEPVPVEVAGVAADSLGARQVGDLAFAACRAAAVEAVVVADDDVRAAQRVLWEEVRVVAEPGGATALAALTSRAYRPGAGERVGVVVCGANTDPATVTGA